MSEQETKVLPLAERIKVEAVAARVAGKGLFFYGARYAYVGNPVEIGEKHVVLEGAALPFDTGEFSNAKWGNLEKFPKGRWTILIDAMESFGIMK